MKSGAQGVGSPSSVVRVPHVPGGHHQRSSEPDYKFGTFVIRIPESQWVTSFVNVDNNSSDTTVSSRTQEIIIKYSWVLSGFPSSPLALGIPQNSH